MTSLRGQLALRLLLGGALLWAAAGGALYWRLRASLTAEFDAALQASAHSLYPFTEQSQGRIVMELAAESMPQFIVPSGAHVYLLRQANGREVKRSPSLGDASLPLRAGLMDSPPYWDDTLPDGRRMRFTGLRFAPLPEDEDPKQVTPGLEAVLVVGRERTPLDRTLGMLRAILGVIGAGALGLLVALVLWSLRAGLRPLDRLGEAVGAVGASSLATRFPQETLPAELRPIAGRLNELLARLESSFERERRFTANVAHELRTPLAELRALAEVNLTTPASDAERAESWRDALATTRRMESVSLRLLELARAEDPARTISRQPVELAAALREAWHPWTARAGQRGILARFDLPGGLKAQADPVLLGVILGNLCANAVEHTPENTAFHVSATARPDSVEMRFHNPAGRLTEADLPHLFERFWKLDAARTDGRHHGLGLAIGAEFAALLGGALTARLRDDGIEFALRLPAG
jgi:two-component system sensor histidine kinase QseC